MENETTSLDVIAETLENIKQKLLKFGGGHVHLHKNETSGIATITLDHPRKRNAMSGTMMVEFRDCIKALEEWKEGKAVIVQGEGNQFCSGADLDYVKANANAQAGLDMSTWMQDTLNRLYNLPLISLCLVQGTTLGGGAEISTFCDFIIVAEDAKYGFVHGRMGIITAWGSGTRLARKIGPSKVLDLLLTAKILNAKECVELGLAEAIVPSDEEALIKATEWLSQRLGHHYTITRAMKRVVANAYRHEYQDSLRLEQLEFEPFWGGKLNLEALNKKINHLK